MQLAAALEVKALCVASGLPVLTFVCADIDQLWLGCSHGTFGLSVQYQIWQEIGGNADANYQTWYRFCDRVGWRVGDCWIPYDSFTFGLDAPKGHLPFLAVGGFGVVVCLQSLFSRLER